MSIRIAALGALLASTAWAQEWSEREVLDRFQAMSPQVRELQARVSLAQAESRARAV